MTANAICPGATSGPRLEDVIERQAAQLDVSYEDAKAAVFTDDTALGSLVDPADVAEMVAYLASDAGSTWY